MRFRTKFAWPQIASNFLWVVLCILNTRIHAEPSGLHSANVVAAWFFGLLLLWSIAAALFTYWDVSDMAIVERRLWNTKSVPWAEINRIAPWPAGKRPNPKMLEVDYTRAGPLSDRGSMIVEPRERADFIAALRKYAPQADFDPTLSQSFVPSN